MSEDAPKLRLRPKLTVDTPAAPVPAAAAPPAVSPAETQAPAAEPKSIRLKPRVSLEPTPPAAAPPTPPPPTAPPPVAFAAVVAAPPLPAPAAIAPQVAAPLSQSDSESPSAAIDYAAQAKKIQRVALLILGGGVVAFAAVGYFALPRLIQRHEEENSPAARLEELIRKSREKNQAAEGSVSPPAAAAAAPTSAPTVPATKPAAAPSQVATKTAAPAATPLPTTETLAPGEASAAFRGWVQNLKITGVRTGAAPKISFGSTSYNVGEIVNHDLGIRFEGYDAPRRMLVFKDANGATVERRH